MQTPIFFFADLYTGIQPKQVVTPSPFFCKDVTILN